MPPTRFHLALALLALLALPLAVVAFNWAGEDCFISYRYAENLASGHGLVFNVTDTTRADRVEGFSNLSWVLLLAGAHALGANTVYASRWLAATAAAWTIWLLGRLGGALDPERPRRPLLLLAPALYLLQPLAQYQVGRALETTLYAALIVLAALLFTRRRLVLCSCALGLVAMTRPEGFLFIIPFVATSAWERWLATPEERTLSSLRGLAALAVPWALISAALEVWRFVYYGHWMPNSVALKTSAGGFLANPSLPLIRDFIVSWSFLPLAAPLAFAGWRSWPHTKRRAMLLAALLIAHQSAFIVAVGRVPAETYRHFVPMIPFLCLCLQEAVGVGLSSIASRPLRLYIVLVCLALNFYTVNNRDGSRTRLHVRVKEFFFSPEGGLNNPVDRWRFHWAWFHHPPIRLDARAGKWVADHLPHDALIAADQMGQFAYHARQPMLDMFGLMDETIARDGLQPDYLFARNPDFIVFMWVIGAGDYTPYQRVIREDPRFAERYRLRWRLRQALPAELQFYEFHVFARRDRDDGQPAEEVVLPGTVEELDHWWRARGE